LLSGERVYGEDRLLRLLFGPAYLLGQNMSAAPSRHHQARD